jgi:hypothetical protein
MRQFLDYWANDGFITKIAKNDPGFNESGTGCTAEQMATRSSSQHELFGVTEVKGSAGNGNSEGNAATETPLRS